jgi:hypothetical protein
LGEPQIVRSGSGPEVEHSEDFGLSGIRNIEHHNLAGLIQGDEKLVPSWWIRINWDQPPSGMALKSNTAVAVPVFGSIR